MAKGKILIVDDDTTVGNAISEAFIREGFETMIETKGKRALSVIRVEKIEGIVIDCMIPGINGVDLAQKIREEVNFHKTIVLISGIFKDKKFAESSIKKAAANDFLFKPLNLDRLVSIFSSVNKPEISEEMNWIDKMIKSDYEFDDMSIQKCDILPFIQTFMSKKLSCEISFDNYVFKFKNGDLVDLFSPNKDKFIKKQLLDNSMTSLEILNKFTDNKTDLIRQVIEKSIISPHLVTGLLENYYLNVINKFLFENESLNFTVKVSMTEETFFKKKLNLKNENFVLIDYVENKLGMLVENYKSTISSFNYSINDKFKEISKIMNLPFLQKNKEIFETIIKESKVANLLEKEKSIEAVKVFYFLHIKGFIDLNQPKITAIEMENLQKRLMLTLQGVKGKSPEQVFKFLGVEDTRAIFVSTFFKSFAKMYHPDKLSQTASKELRDLNQQVFSIVSEAHDTLTDLDKKAAYEKEIQNKQVEKVLYAESLKEKAQQLLSRSKFDEALSIFDEARSIHTDPMLTLYYYWCYFKVNKKIEEKKELLRIYNELVAFEIEDKRNELFALVLGIFYKRSKKYEEALGEFQKSLGYNKNFLPARREFMNLKSQLDKLGKSENILTGDLSTVVSGFFKKKA